MMENINNKVNEEDLAVYNEMLKNLDVKEIYSLCTKISEKFLDNDNEMYKYFHDKTIFSEEEKDE